MRNSPHSGWMRQALALARSREGWTRPNPPVGAVVVRAGRVVGRGCHARAGEPHAEVLALAEAGPAARGATLYVTLEPCCTWGRTGPCTAIIQKAGVRRVVISVRDPNPRHAGRGLRLLRRAGIEVVEDVLTAEGQALIDPFARWITTGRPLVTLKLAVSADGRIADVDGRSKWITGETARARVQAWRAAVDAILVGIETALADDPMLTCRLPGAPEAYRVVVDSRGRLPLKAKVLTAGRSARTVIATTARCPLARRAAYRRRGATVLVLPSAGGRVSLRALMRALGKLGLLHVLCEGGGTLAQGLLQAGLVDRVRLMLAPLLLGGGSLPAVGGGGWTLKQAPRLVWTSVEQLGEDVLLSGTMQQAVRPKGRSRDVHGID